VISTLRKRTAVLGGGALALTLLATTTGCQLAHTAGAGRGVEAAVDQLMSREAVTVEATFLASPDEVYTYLQESAELTGEQAPDRQDAEVLSALELTAVAGDPEQERKMRDLGREDPLNAALSVGFGGKDAVGIKQIEGQLYLRVGADTVVQDVLGGDPLAMAAAERFMRRAGELPDSLGTATRALTGAWVLVDPYLYFAYGEALAAGADDEAQGDAAEPDGRRPGAAGPGVDRAMSERLAAALTETAPLLEADAQWDLVDGLARAVRSGASLRDAGEERGANLVELELPAAHAEQALAPLLGLLDAQGNRFGLPSVVHDPVDPDGKVTAELAIRNGVLSEITFDLGQFGGADFAELPLRLSLNSGSAISLTAPDAPMLQPEDLTVALLYMELLEEQRRNDPRRGDIPGPMQP
jgi:hypothetical protein